VVNGGNRSGIGKVKRLIETDVDLLFVLTEAGEQFLIPCNEITARKCINLGVNYQQYKVS
jgi:ribosomal 30S subunit maturation factor RimM